MLFCTTRLTSNLFVWRCRFNVLIGCIRRRRLIDHDRLKHESWLRRSPCRSLCCVSDRTSWSVGMLVETL
jgi:hypothetical protein